MAFDEDLDIYFDLDGFAVECLINTVPPRTIKVIFNSPTESLGLYEANVEAAAPYLKCQSADIAGVKRGRTATINAVTYTIERVAHDGNGTSNLYLKT